MSEATRAIALQEAVRHHGDTADAAIVVKTAALFHAFLSQSPAASATAPEQTDPTPAPARRGRPPVNKEAAPAAAAAAAPVADTGATQAALVDAIGKLAKKDRPTCVGILSKFGAKSASSVDPKDHAECLKQITAALETTSEDLAS